MNGFTRIDKKNFILTVFFILLIIPLVNADATGLMFFAGAVTIVMILFWIGVLVGAIFYLKWIIKKVRESE
jgi:predicted branched-subunit amino acid permease